jgi:hypothetical protein
MTPSGLSLALLMLLLLAALPANAWHTSIYDSAREGARQGALDAAAEERQRAAEEAAAARAQIERELRDATARDYWRRDSERLSGAALRLNTPEGRAETDAYYAKLRTLFTADARELVKALRLFLSVQDEGTIVEHATWLRTEVASFTRRHEIMLGRREPKEAVEVAEGAFRAADGVDAYANGVLARRELGERVAYLTRELAKPHNLRAPDAHADNLRLVTARRERLEREHPARWASTQTLIQQAVTLAERK